MNPNFFPNRDSGYDRGHGSDRSLGYHGDGDRDRRGGYDRPSVSDAEFDEIMHKNRSVCDTSTERAIAAAGAGKGAFSALLPFVRLFFPFLLL